jgi:hypothetical protein
VRFVPNDELVQALTDAAFRLISASPDGIVEGADVARDIGRDPEDPNAELHHAFWEIDRRGQLVVSAWEGGMGLPTDVRLPRVR